MEYWIFPTRVVAKPGETVSPIGRHHQIFWSRDDGSIARWGSVVAVDRRAGTIEVNLKPLADGIKRQQVETVLGVAATEKAPSTAPLAPLDPKKAARLLALARRRPQSLTEKLGDRAVQLLQPVARGLRDASTWVPGSLGSAMRKSLDHLAAGHAEMEPAGAEVERTTCWLLPDASFVARAPESREERILEPRDHPEIELGDRVLWLEANGSISDWGTVIAKSGTGARRRAARTVTTYRRALSSRVAADRVPKLPRYGREVRVSAGQRKDFHEFTTTTPRSFAEAFREELAEIYRLRKLRRTSPRREPEAVVFHQAHRAQLAGLAFSGGGIRSATFNLGILQGLAGRGLLRGFDYLSTVSGGGYIGAWLAAWIRNDLKDDGKNGREDEPRGILRVQSRLAVEHPEVGRDQAVPAAERRSPITFLREYSNFLTPRVGLFGADTWTAVATYARNLLLNLLILVAALSALLLVPRIAVTISSFSRSGYGPTVALVVAVLFLVVGVGSLSRNVRELSSSLAAGSWRSDRLVGTGKVQSTVILPLFVSAWAGSCWIWTAKNSGPSGRDAWWPFNLLAAKVGVIARLPAWSRWMLAAALLYLGLWLSVSWFAAWRLKRKGRKLGWREKWQTILLALTAFLAGLGGGALLWWSAGLLYQQTAGGFALMIIWGPPLMVLAMVITAVLHIGLMGRDFPEFHRQWWSRLGAWLLIYSLCWIGFFSLALYGPVAIGWIAEEKHLSGRGCQPELGGVDRGRHLGRPQLIHRSRRVEEAPGAPGSGHTLRVRRRALRPCSLSAIQAVTSL